MSDPPAPMEMRAVAEIPSDGGWLYEPKWDGFRCVAVRRDGAVELWSKHGQPLGRYFPEIVAAVAALPGGDCTLDGELVVPAAGALSFDALQQRIHPATSRVARLASSSPAWYLVFDVLRDGQDDVAARPLRGRRAHLERLAAERFTPGGPLRLSPATTELEVVHDWYRRVGGALDGVVAKRLENAYAFGARDAAVKVKQQRTADCVVGGYRLASGSTTRIGSLLLGLYDAAGKLDYIGFCSSFGAREREALLARLAPLAGGAGFSGAAPDTSPSRWDRNRERDKSYVALRPELVLEVAFDQVTAGRIRHGTRPLRWRTEKPPRACTVDQLDMPDRALLLLDGRDSTGRPA